MNRKNFLRVLAAILPIALVRSQSTAATAAVARENGTIAEVDPQSGSSGIIARDLGGSITYSNSPGFNVGDRVSFQIEPGSQGHPTATNLQPITPEPDSGDGGDAGDAAGADGGDGGGGDGAGDGN